MTPAEVKDAHAALERFDRLVADWHQSHHITTIAAYYDGYPSRDIRDKSLLEEIKFRVMQYHRNEINKQLEFLQSVGVDARNLLPKDWDNADA